MRVHAYIPFDRMVASAYTKEATRKKQRVLVWHDTRDIGGVYDRLETWMSRVQLDHAAEHVWFVLEEEVK